MRFEVTIEEDTPYVKPFGTHVLLRKETSLELSRHRPIFRYSNSVNRDETATQRLVRITSGRFVSCTDLQ